MIEIARHQAIDALPFWNESSQSAGFLHGAETGTRVSLPQEFPPDLPGSLQRCIFGQSPANSLFGIACQAELMSRDELHQSHYQRRVGIELLGPAQQHLLPRDG